MTQEEKAKEIAELHKIIYIANAGEHGSSYLECYSSAMQMAEWKEEQIKSNLQKAFNCMVFRQDHSLSNKEHQYVDLDIVQNIIESFFHTKLDEYGE